MCVCVCLCIECVFLTQAGIGAPDVTQRVSVVVVSAAFTVRSGGVMSAGVTHSSAAAARRLVALRVKVTAIRVIITLTACTYMEQFIICLLISFHIYFNTLY